MNETIIPDDTVSKFYEMNPETEFVIGKGEQLSNGMIVLIENLNSRTYAAQDTKYQGRSEAYNSRRTNRWCQVTCVEIVENEVIFLGVYADGLVAQRRYSVHDAWLCKIGVSR